MSIMAQIGYPEHKFSQKLGKGSEVVSAAQEERFSVRVQLIDCQKIKVVTKNNVWVNGPLLQIICAPACPVILSGFPDMTATRNSHEPSSLQS